MAVIAGLLLVGLAAAGEVKVAAGAKSVDVSVVRRVDASYFLATRQAPLEFAARGPCWVRVYTRLWWPGTGTGTQKYELSLWQGDVERPLVLESGVSPSSYGPDGHKVGEWRSFYVQVQEPNTNYRLVVTQGETVAVRFALQSPKPWKSVSIPGLGAMTLAEGRDTTQFQHLATGDVVPLDLTGPCRVRVRVRINFGPELQGVQSFVLTARQGTMQLARRNLKAGPSGSAVFTDSPGLVPSSERTLRFNLPGGPHRVSLVLSGTLARSGAVAVEVIAGERYE
jgi:hypothetical protein